MTDEEFDTFVCTCNEELRAKQLALEKQLGLGRHTSWAYDGNSGILTFADEQGLTLVEADTTQLGSYSVNSNTWLWAWANPSVTESERIKSAKLKTLCDRTGMDVFRHEGFEADEQMAWEVAAMGIHELGALGCYRGPAKHLYETQRPNSRALARTTIARKPASLEKWLHTRHKRSLSRRKTPNTGIQPTARKSRRG